MPRLNAVALKSFALAAMLALCANTLAQSGAVGAHVASVNGLVLRLSRSGAPALLKPGDALTPNDEIDTRGGGRVVIELTDGSLITVLPGSRVVFGDYRFASSLRQLFKITVGRVRVKINHYSGKPNPYRVNSPTASIAVRGTDFSVAVTARGETQVVVYEGLVEVTTLNDPHRRVLVEPGRAVIVRPNEDIRFFAPNRSNEIGERDNKQYKQQGRQAQSSNSNGGVGGQDAERTASSDYERYIDSFVQPTEAPPLARFTAFADSHLDSLENPAYATEFAAAEGDLFLLPSFSGTARRNRNFVALGSDSLRPIDYGMLLQTSIFAPLPNSRLVMGGSFTTDHSRLQSFTFEEGTGLSAPLFPPGAIGSRAATSSTNTTSIAGSLLVARKFGGAGRTSFGFGLDHTAGRGSLLDLTTETDSSGLTASQRLDAHSNIERTRISFGFAREFSSGLKLGIFYRYSLASLDDRDRTDTLNGAPRALESTRAGSRPSELGFRMRGPIMKRLFYGVEGTLLFGALDERKRGAGESDQIGRERFEQGNLSFGLGYALRPRTVFSFDVAGAFSLANQSQLETATGIPLNSEQQRIKSLSAHGAVQTDVWRRLYVNASILAPVQERETKSPLLVNSLTRDRLYIYHSDYGIGWRFTPNFIAQYVFSTEYESHPSGYSLLLRYTFNLGVRSSDLNR
ncbi:MAG: FecR domain-containing protein [Chloracidobacterium sp.]|nr:FecR domain-containing protein [Chloracidobacterium sp.]